MWRWSITHGMWFNWIYNEIQSHIITFTTAWNAIQFYPLDAYRMGFSCMEIDSIVYWLGALVWKWSTIYGMGYNCI